MSDEKVFDENVFTNILNTKAVGDNWIGIKSGIVLARQKGYSLEELSEFAENTPVGDELWELFLRRRSIIGRLGFQYDFSDLVEEVLDKDIIL